MQTESSRNLFSRPAFIGIMILGLTAVSVRAFYLKGLSIPSISPRAEWLGVWIPLLACFGIGTNCLFRYIKRKQLNDMVISLLPVLFTLLIIMLEFLEVRKS